MKNENKDMINTNISSLMSTFDLSKHHHHQDLSGAIERISAEFRNSKKEIISSFADEDGKILSILNKEDFIRLLYTSTENISKNDINIISLRFFDGNVVSIVDFLDFFITPNTIRQAKVCINAYVCTYIYMDVFAFTYVFTYSFTCICICC
jgi:hypothetical protein